MFKFLLVLLFLNTSYAIDQVNPGEKIEASKINELIQAIEENQKKGLLQVKQVLKTTAEVYSGSTDRNNPTFIGVLDISLVTTADNSDILYSINMQCELSENNVWILQRNLLDPSDPNFNSSWTELGSHTGTVGSSQLYGLWAHTYDADTASTIEVISREFLDSPLVPAGTTVSYRLGYYGQGNTLYLNRTLSNTDSNSREKVSSNVILKEIGK